VLDILYLSRCSLLTCFRVRTLLAQLGCTVFLFFRGAVFLLRRSGRGTFGTALRLLELRQRPSVFLPSQAPPPFYSLFSSSLLLLNLPNRGLLNLMPPGEGSRSSTSLFPKAILVSDLIFLYSFFAVKRGWVCLGAPFLHHLHLFLLFGAPSPSAGPSLRRFLGFSGRGLPSYSAISDPPLFTAPL